MNPFALPGPEFLKLFGLLSIAVIAVCWWRVYQHGDGPPPPVRELTQDPYRIAYLRGGWDEALRVAVFNLVDRGLVAYNGEVLVAEREDAEQFVTRSLDKVILRLCTRPIDVDQLIANPSLRAAVEEYDRALAVRGLVPDEAENLARIRFGWAAAGLLGGVALVKVVSALSQGRGNVFFLFALAVVAMTGVAFACQWQPTRAGRRSVAHLQSLMTRLVNSASRLRPGGATNEALMLVAVYGFGPLPRNAFPIVKRLRRAKANDGSSDSGSSSCGAGSSCGSSSCGGGGGCGGCGSD